MRQNLFNPALFDPMVEKGDSARVQSSTLAAEYTLTTEHPPIQAIDPGGAGRDVLLPAEASSTGLRFVILNTADAAETLTVKEDSDTNTIGSVEQGGVGVFTCDGMTWYGLTTIPAGVSAAELGYIDIATLGTGAASKAVVLDASADYTYPAAGTIVYPSGATLTLESGSTFNVAGTNQIGGVAVTATAAELNMAADNSANVEVVATANVITAAESGTTYFLNSATGFQSTLPAPAAGLRYKFIVTTQPTSGNHTVVTNASANVIEGGVDVNSAHVPAANEDTINFVASTAIISDWVQVISDGTSWFVEGASGGGAGAVTFAAT